MSCEAFPCAKHVHAAGSLIAFGSSLALSVKRGEVPKGELVSWARVVGSLLVAISVVGFVTIADDLRHVGEILGVGSVLVIGLLLLVASWTKLVSNRVALLWLAGAVGVGAIAGAGMDNMPVGVVGGVTVGVVTAAVAARRRGRASG